MAANLVKLNDQRRKIEHIFKTIENMVVACFKGIRLLQITRPKYRFLKPKNFYDEVVIKKHRESIIKKAKEGAKEAERLMRKNKIYKFDLLLSLEVFNTVSDSCKGCTLLGFRGVYFEEDDKDNECLALRRIGEIKAMIHGADAV